MPFSIVQGGLTTFDTDAIVNAANRQLQMGGGVCGSIFRKAGPAKLQKACDSLAPIHTAQAVITPGFSLPARFIIHAAGPIYSKDHERQCESLLRKTYRSALQLAKDNHLKSIAFPLISSGIYGYPKREALSIAVDEIRSFLEQSPDDPDVYLVIFDRDTFEMSPQILRQVEQYVQKHYDQDEIFEGALLEDEIPEDWDRMEKVSIARYQPQAAPQLAPAFLGEPDGLKDHLKNLKEPFNAALLKLIDSKGLKDSEVYKKANISRQTFSKIRSGKGYLPSKPTILALAIALKLSLPETDDLLEKAGYALSHSQLLDVVVEYFLKNRDYDIFTINQVLFEYNLPCLGGK